MQFLVARYGAHAANSRHPGGAAVLEDVSLDSDDECRARVDEVCAPLFQKKTHHRFSPSRPSSSLQHPSCQLKPPVIVPSLRPWFVHPRFAENAHQLASRFVAYGTALGSPNLTSALTCPPPNSVFLGSFF